MTSRRRAIGLVSLGMLAVVASVGLVGVAPAAAANTYVVTNAIQQGTTWETFSDSPTYANEPKVLPGDHNFRVTLTNKSSSAVAITSIDSGIAGASTTCTTALIAKGKSGSCTIAVTIASGALSFTLKTFLSNSLEVISADHSLIGVAYDLETTMLISTPGGLVSPGDPSLQTLPLGYIPRTNLRVTNGSTVTITNVTVPGFTTKSCGSALTTIAANTLVLCNGAPAVSPAGTTPTLLTTGAVGNGVFPGDRPGLGVSLTYQGIGGCTASHPTVTAGQRQTISCTGFVAATTVGSFLHSTATVWLGSHLTQADGSLTFAFTVPLATRGGAHHVSITVAGHTVTTAPFTVTAAAGLPVTGTDPDAPLGVAGSLIALGAIGVLHARVRRRQRAV
jgi:hypothetical protein